MPEDLERDLGLYATITVSVGAMIGSGLFVLPGLAAAKTGPSVIVAYVLAGLIVLPAALSKAEMATAIPESGGTYLYIDRAMGPLIGTISGIGAWFSLVFKSAFALVGLGAYLVLILPLPSAGLKSVSLVLGLALILVNLVGIKQSGRLQATIVTIVVGALAVTGIMGVPSVSLEQYRPFLTHGPGGLLAATGFVFVSYAGVTKIASIAEEVEDPDRNLPLGMLLSVGLMIPLYAVIVYVMVGVMSPEVLHDNLTPMAETGSVLFGPVGQLIAAGLAVLALTSMANAGVLSSSRFPLAMSRDRLAPDSLSVISDRFGTPARSIWITGGLLLLLVAFVPVVELAKLASAFKILIFTLINVALIAFREGGPESYDPAFRSPGYPWVQFGGIVGGIVLLTQMGPIPMLGAIGIIAIGILWYQVYGRDRTDREGAMTAQWAGREDEHLDYELRGIMRKKGPRDEDPVEDVVAKASVLDLPDAEAYEEVMEQVAKILSQRIPYRAETVRDRLQTGRQTGATPVTHGVALPHLRLKRINEPVLVLARTAHGVRVDEEHEPIHCFCVLVSPEDDPTQHLRMLAHIAEQVDAPDFMACWMECDDPLALKELFLRDERYVTLTVRSEDGTAELVDTALRDVAWPEDSLVTLVHRGDSVIIPRGHTVLRSGDRLVLVGTPESMDAIRERYGEEEPEPAG